MTLEEKTNAEKVMINFIDAYAEVKKLNKEQFEYLLLLFNKFDIDIKLEGINKNLIIPEKKKRKKDK